MNHSGVVVAWVVVPKLVRPVVKGQMVLPPVGQVVRQISPVKQSVVAVSIDDDAP